MNAEYYGSRGVVIMKNQNRITMENPGGFRINIDDAKSGGVSDPRNTTLIKMFNLIQIGARVGSGIPNIYQTWKKQGWDTPLIVESFEPERTTVSLSISPVTGDKTGDNQRAAIKTGDKIQRQKELVVEYITDNVSASASDIAELLGLKSSRTREILRQMIDEEILVSEGKKQKQNLQT